MQTYGPNLTETYVQNPALIEFMDLCTKYVSNLSEFKRYCVWRYTIGSASINSFLIMGKLSSNATQWSYLFFKYYFNTFPNVRVPNPLLKLKNFFANPESFRLLPKDTQTKVANHLIVVYINYMQDIIKKAPRTPGAFNVFKVASPYPGLPLSNDSLPAPVLQLPFNSTTITPYFNFAPFLAPNADCCLFSIKMPPGSMCLFVPQEYHAYPFELEIILPHDCVFEILSIEKAFLNTVDPKTVKMIEVQPKKDIEMGAVYRLNEYAPCGPLGCKIQRKQFNVYNCDYYNPS